MSDIRTISTAGPMGFAFDWALSNGAMQADDGMETAVIHSLFTEATAAPDDVLPDKSGDRRGCWMDIPLDSEPVKPMGSKLWLLARAKATRETAARARRYALDALQWFIDDGVAEGVEVTAAYVTREMLKLSINIIRQVGGQLVNHRFDFLWNPAQPAPFVPRTPDLLATENGDLLVTEDGKTIGIF